MSDYEATPLIPIQNRKFLSIEYPGYVKRVDRALKTLGGEKALSKALSEDGTVLLKYRASDSFSHPITGDFLNTCKLLAKVTRRVKRSKKTGEIVEEEGEEEQPWKIDVMGTVTKTVRFRSLADYQYIVPKDDRIRSLKDALWRGDDQKIIDFRLGSEKNNDNSGGIPPPLFSAVEVPFNYNYRQNAPVIKVRVKQPDGSYVIKMVNRSRYVTINITSVSYKDESMPTKSWHSLEDESTVEFKDAIEEVRKLFEIRPVWCRFALRAHMNVDNRKYATRAAVYLAYNFNSGPWRDCWVKYGIDPRKDQTYHIYQCMNFRKIGARDVVSHKALVNRKSKQAVMDSTYLTKPQSASETNECTFDGKTPLGFSTCQLCDITDPDFVGLIHNPAYLKPESSSASGFYYRCVYDRLRHGLKKKAIELQEDKVPERLLDLEEGLMEDVEEEIRKASKEQEGDDDDEDYEDEDEDEDRDVIRTASAEKAAMDAMKETNKPGSSNRLRKVVDDFISEMENTESNNNEMEYDMDLEDLEGLEEYEEAGGEEEMDEEDMEMRE